MKSAFSIFLCVLFIGCTNRDQAALKAYEEAQQQRYSRYESGSIPEAKQALHEIIACAQEHRGKLRLYYGAEWETALCYGRLALIAEQEKDLQVATNLWNAAVDAQLQAQKDERAWARVTPGVRIPNQGSDVYTPVPAEAIKKFLIGLEAKRTVAWRPTPILPPDGPTNGLSQ
jgi:tetratricopeptide (TPR) repeat protein